MNSLSSNIGCDTLCAMQSEEPIYLDCPYSEKDQVKQLGARFNGAVKKWYIPVGLEVEPFVRWLPDDFLASQPIAAISDVANDTDSLSLYELLAQIKHSIEQQHAQRYWVRAEIISVSTRQHVYLELSDYAENGQEIAKVRAMIWQSRAENLLNKFEQQTGMPFASGIKVLLQVVVTFHPLYGLALEVVNLDPSFTLGELAAKIQKIRQQLQQEGIYAQNHQLAQPQEFCKVAVIAPPQAAGLGDFRSQADVLQQQHLCEFHYYSANFQGDRITEQIPAAFAEINQAHKTQQFDAIVMIRGGGAKGDLYQLNEYIIAKAICTAKLPVIVGIGHERDETLLDEVANHRCHTPSLVISHIAGIIIQNARGAQQAWQWIQHTANSRLQQAKVNSYQHYRDIRECALAQLHDSRQQLTIWQQTLQQVTRQQVRQAHIANQATYSFIREQALQQLSNSRQRLDALQQSVHNSRQQQLQISRHQIKSLLEQVLLGDPQHIVQRGYVIVKNNKNEPLTSKASAFQQTQLVLQFKDGELQVKVLK